MDVRTLFASQGYENARPVTKPDASSATSVGGTVRAAALDFAETLRRSEEVSVNSMTGKADPHQLVHALAQTELAVETAISVRDKVVEAYQEILRMPV